MVMVDESHAGGFMGKRGRGTPESTGAAAASTSSPARWARRWAVRAAAITSRREIIELLRQRSRPYLFSNTVAPPIVGASIAALDLLESSGELRDKLDANTAYFRERLGRIGFEIKPGEHPIVPMMLGDANLAQR